MTAETQVGGAAGKLKARLVGEAVIKPLKSVKPNQWNANEMTVEEMDSLKHGLVHDGWLVSQALLIWGTDEKGVKQNVIIDGEHRWTGATEVGLTKGPMVFLHGLPEAEAQKLTIKLNQKRGKWNEAKLEEQLRALREGGTDLTGVDLGFNDDALTVLLAQPVNMNDAPVIVGEGSASGDPPAGSPPPDAPPAQAAKQMVKLYVDAITQSNFKGDCEALSTAWGTTSMTDTVLEAVRRARAGLPGV